jgi:hypothetical protein
MATASPPSSRPWLFGPAPDLLLGCGVLYLALFGLFVAAGDWWSRTVPGWLVPFCVLVLSMPHYGATLVRVYEHRTDRRAYAFFTVWTTLLLVGAFVAGLYSPVVGSVLLTLYLTWSPWHYTGQNYGLAVMFLRRRGVPIQGPPKRWLYASFALSYALTLCVIHESGVWAGARSLPQDGPFLHFVPLGIPAADWLLPAIGVAWGVSSVVALAWTFRQAGSGGAPVALLVLTQSLWFAIPAAALHWGLFEGVAPLAPDSLGAFLMWIAVGHAVQYLWVTAYYARASNDWHGLLPWFGKTLAAGALVWTLPVVVFAAQPLGSPSYETGLAFLVASVVNLHHFILDGAIWKLRNGRIARVLVGSGAAEPEETPRSRGLRIGVWALATASLAVALFVFVSESWLLPRALASRDTQGAVALLDSLAWVGRDASQVRSSVGFQLAEDGQPRAALAQFQRSAALRPAARTYGLIAAVHAQLGDVGASRRAQERALALAPDDRDLFEWAARLSAHLGDRERALDLLARARAIAADAEPALRGAGEGAAY